MLAKFSGFNPKGPHLSLEKEKVTFCVVFTYSAKRRVKLGSFMSIRNVKIKKRDARAKLWFC